MNETTETTARATPAIYLILAWLFVLIPLGWGVWQTLQNAMKLFQ